MTATNLLQPPGPDDDDDGARWAPLAGPAPFCGIPHSGVGRFDESARRLDHPELAVAHQLASEGHDVTSLAVRRGGGRTADLEVCGSPVEVKSFLSLAERNGRPPTAKSVFNRFADAREQAPTTIVYGRGRGLREAAAEAGIELFAGQRRWGHIKTVRVLGDGFDVSWSRSLEMTRRAGLRVRDSAPPSPSPASKSPRRDDPQRRRSRGLELG